MPSFSTLANVIDASGEIYASKVRCIRSDVGLAHIDTLAFHELGGSPHGRYYQGSDRPCPHVSRKETNRGRR